MGGPLDLWPYPIPPQRFFFDFGPPLHTPSMIFTGKKSLRGGMAPYIPPQWFIVPDQNDPPPTSFLRMRKLYPLPFFRHRLVPISDLSFAMIFLNPQTSNISFNCIYLLPKINISILVCVYFHPVPLNRQKLTKYWENCFKRTWINCHGCRWFVFSSRTRHHLVFYYLKTIDSNWNECLVTLK